MTKRIAFIANNRAAPWGGSEELWAQAALRMVKLGYQVGVSVKGWQPAAQKVTALSKAGCRVTYRWYDKTLFHRLQNRFYKEKHHHRWLDRFKPDLTIISQASNIDGIDWMEACLERGIPFAPIAQAAAPNYWPPDPMAERLAAAYGQAIASFFVSQRNIDLTVKQIAANLPNAQVVRNPFKVSYDARPPWPEPQGTFKLACVGRLEPFSKGQDVLFEVLRADKWKQRSLQVTLYGKGSSQATLAKLKTLWDLEQIKFGAYVDDIEGIWASHHGLILPSRYEGLPLAVVEAMLCGRLCIVTDVAGNTELIEDHVHGFVAAAPQPACLDDALERAWQQREQWYDIGQAAAVQVRKAVPRDAVGNFVSKLEGLLK
ncbi:MAG: glycosyltransferase family 4 protein [Cyanobacteria bacterium J06623_5]